MKLNFLKENYIKGKTETFCKTKVSDHAAMSGTHTDYVTLKCRTEPLRLTVQVASWYMLGFTHTPAILLVVMVACALLCRMCLMR